MRKCIRHSTIFHLLTIYESFFFLCSVRKPRQHKLVKNYLRSLFRIEDEKNLQIKLVKKKLKVFLFLEL